MTPAPRGLLGPVLALALSAGQPKNDPFMVRIIDPPSDVSALGDVMLGALGITGIIILSALVAGLVFAGAMFWVRSRSSRDET